MRFFNEVHKDSTSNLWSNSIKSKKPFISPVKLGNAIALVLIGFSTQGSSLTSHVFYIQLLNLMRSPNKQLKMLEIG